MDTNLKKPTVKQPDERLSTNFRSLQKFLNRQFSLGQEDISPNSQAATYPWVEALSSCRPMMPT